MHYALDETLASLGSATSSCNAHMAFEAAIKGPGLAALVLKPTLLGGFARCLSLHRRAPPGTQVCTSCVHVHCVYDIYYIRSGEYMYIHMYVYIYIYIYIYVLIDICVHISM